LNTDHNGRQRKSRRSSSEVDDDRPVNGNETIVDLETSPDSPDVAEITGVHPEYLRLLGCMIIFLPSFFMITGTGYHPIGLDAPVFTLNI